MHGKLIGSLALLATLLGPACRQVPGKPFLGALQAALASNPQPEVQVTLHRPVDQSAAIRRQVEAAWSP